MPMQRRASLTASCSCWAPQHLNATARCADAQAKGHELADLRVAHADLLLQLDREKLAEVVDRLHLIPRGESVCALHRAG